MFFNAASPSELRRRAELIRKIAARITEDGDDFIIADVVAERIEQIASELEKAQNN